MLIPHDKLPADVLQAVIEEFVTREGTDYGAQDYSLADKVAHVKKQLERGDAVISFNQETETVTLLCDRDAIQLLRESDA
jgi:uncharacterized protein YheU (UPF0270 family)